MSQRSIFDDEDELPVRKPSSDPWSKLGLRDRRYYDCAPCQGSGWSGFFPGGGTVCAGCGGSGRQANRDEQKRKRTALE